MSRLDRLRFPLPRFVQFYPTFRCNQRCSFCFNDSSQIGEMSFAQALSLLDVLSTNSISELDIMGGEPLLLSWIPDFVGAALKKGIAVNLSTNGSRPDMIGNFRDFSDRDLSIGVSLEGSTADKHNRLTASSNFAAAMESIDMLSASGFDPVVKTIVTRETMADIQAIADLLKKKGVCRYYLLHMDLMSDDGVLRTAALGYPAFLFFYERIRNANPEISILRVNASCFERNALPPGVRCAAGVKKLAVMPDGSVYPCNLFHRLRSFRLGNIFGLELGAIWNSPVLDVFRRGGQNSCAVADCANQASCSGGCPAHAYWSGRGLSAGDVRCLA